MSLKIILVMPAFLVIAAAEAAEQSRQSTVIHDMAPKASRDLAATPAPQGPVPVPYPNTIGARDAGGSTAGSGYAGTHVLYQDVVVPSAVKDGSSNTLMIGERLPANAQPTGLNSLKSLQGTQDLFGNGQSAGQRARHSSGVNVVLADGSVRFSEDGKDGEGGLGLANPTGGGTKLPAVQKVREAATRVDEQRAGTGSSQGVSVNLQRLANPSLPTAGGGPQVKVFDGGSGAQAATQGRGVFTLSTDRAAPAGARIK